MRKYLAVCLALAAGSMIGCGGKTEAQIQTDTLIKLRALGWERTSMGKIPGICFHIEGYKDGFHFSVGINSFSFNDIVDVGVGPDVVTETKSKAYELRYGELQYQKNNFLSFSPQQDTKSPYLPHDRLERAKYLGSEFINAFFAATK